MAEIRIALRDDQLDRLREISNRYGISPEDLARVGVEDLLSRPDEPIEALIDYVLEKNKDLYKRLAR
jgi:hypothetical protein